MGFHAVRFWKLVRSCGQGVSRYSTTSAPFRTSETNPAKLGKSNLGRFYTVDSELFKSTLSPIGAFPVNVRENFKTFGEHCVMVRKPFLDIKSCLEATDVNSRVLRFVVFGPPGSGKSMTIGCLAHYAVTLDYILVFVHWAPLWTRFHKEVVQSNNRPGMWDHTINAVNWLLQFKFANENKLRQLEFKTTKTYKWSQREETPEGSDLMEIVEHGITRPPHASESIIALIQELKWLSSQKRCKTMVLIDGINAFYYKCVKLRKPNRQFILPEEISVFEAFKDLLKTDWTGGAVICTVDKLAGQSEMRESDLPRYLLTKEGWEDLDPFVPVQVENYSSQEVQTTIDYYLDRQWLQHPMASSDDARLELEYVSTRNPLTLMELCNSR